MLFRQPTLLPTLPVTLSLANLFHTIHNREAPLRWPRLIIRTGQDKGVLVVVVLAFSQASWRKQHVDSWIQNDGDDESRDETKSTKLHQVVRDAVYIGTAQDVTWECWRDGEEEGQESAPVESVYTLSALIENLAWDCGGVALTRCCTSKYSPRSQCIDRAS